ncbi:MAG: HupE/UreJ family protein [Thiogranum sp.]|jgi:urease accessory protein
MHLFKRLLLTLTASTSLVSGIALAHPGHQHQPGILAGIAHSIIGWDQLVVLVAGGILVGYLLLRQR